MPRHFHAHLHSSANLERLRETRLGVRRALALREDLAFLSGTGSGGEPMGFRQTGPRAVVGKIDSGLTPREALTEILAPEEGLEIVGASGDPPEILARVAEVHPDVLPLDPAAAENLELIREFANRGRDGEGRGARLLYFRWDSSEIYEGCQHCDRTPRAAKKGITVGYTGSGVITKARAAQRYRAGRDSPGRQWLPGAREDRDGRVHVPRGRDLPRVWIVSRHSRKELKCKH